MDSPSDNNEIWQVETNGQVFDAQLEEIASWIGDGSLLRIDRVRKGNLRWIEAGKVPALDKFFNAKDSTEPPIPVVTVSSTEVLGRAKAPRTPDGDRRNAPAKWAGTDRRQGDRRQKVYPKITNESIVDVADSANCEVHTDAPARYVCDTCTSQFCKACPSAYGANVKICPFCGAMCSPIEAATSIPDNVYASAPSGSLGTFGFGDFGAALAFPFRFKVSLIFGAIMFAIFQIAQGGGPFGGIFMIAASLTCFMCSNMMTFGVMANTIDNFAKGELNANFMPSFDDFNLWDDVVHPFFLSIGVYISSFGPLIAVVLFAFFFIANSIGGLGDDAAAKIDPQYAAAPKVLNQGQALQQLANNAAQAQQRRVQAMQGNSEQLDGQAMQQAEDQRFQQVDKMIQDTRRGQLEQAIGKTPETKAAEQKAMIQKVMGYGAVFLIVGGLALLWGLFYFPAACAVAGYTRSFGATLNPTVGLDTIKRLGGSYVLILVMCLMLAIGSGFVNGVLGVVFSAFDMPSVGNLPARFFSSIVGFYFWVVFSCILGSALFRSSDKLALARE